MFRSIFKSMRKREEPLPDYSFLSTDMHSHLIPGIDDGAQTIEDSLTLIRELKALGFRKLITTPHIMSDFYRNNPQNIGEGLEKLRIALRDEQIEMEIQAAAEYYIDDGFMTKMEDKELLTFGDRHLLFEISFINCPENLDDIIFRMQILGYKPVMAHPERYPFWYNQFERYESLHDRGVLLQVNINSLAGYYGIDARKIAERLVQRGLVSLLGTDCHHMRHIEGLRRGLKEEIMRKLSGMDLLNSKL